MPSALGRRRPHVREIAQAAIERYELAKAINASEHVFCFKVVLVGSNPPIWRRIETPDGTLDDLHEHIQTAMGWTNSHLHHFVIRGRRYGDPKLLDDGWGDHDLVDPTSTRLGALVADVRRSFRFTYEYDFGDDWEHEVVFEGRSAAEPGVEYPRCVDGARACPPEDVGGVWGYADFLEAINDPKHAEHQHMLEWIGGRFNPEKFSAALATREMRRRLPDWRRSR